MAERAIQTEPAARYGHKDVRSVAKNPVPRIPRRKRSRKIRCMALPGDVRSADATRRTRSVAAVSYSTHDKDSFFARSPCHSTTSRISPTRLGARFDRRCTLQLELTGLAARPRAAETRMNIEFSRWVETPSRFY